MTRADLDRKIAAALTRLCIVEAVQPDGSDGRSGHRIEGDGPDFLWITFRDGNETERREVDCDEAVYLMLEAITARLAREEEERTRKARKGFRPLLLYITGRGGVGAGSDDYSRQTWMNAHTRLMAAVHQGWGTRVALNYDLMLRKFPLTPDERRNARDLDLSAFGVE